MKTFAPTYVINASWVLVLALPMAGAVAGESYSPPVDRSYPSNVYWGDTHVHTALSGDAYAMGARLMPDDAYRFAKGETVRASGGGEVRLRRPLDFLMVSDHAENLGVLPRLAAGDGSVPATEVSERWADALADHPPVRNVLLAQRLDAFESGRRLLLSAKAAHGDDYSLDEGFERSVWEEVIADAERHNDPGRFTAFIGYEWTARAAENKQIGRAHV